MELTIQNKVKRLWDAWHLRGLVILSLFLQAFLVSFTSHRKRSKSTFLLFIWSAYLLADWVAAVAIGVIIKTQTDFCDQQVNIADDLMAFWASFLLLHLGDPDSITSYALEDNELWVRHFFGLVLQGTAASYSIYLTLPTNKLWLPSILILAVGIFKYGERTYALYLASSDHFGVETLRETSLTSNPQNHDPTEVLRLPNMNPMQLLEVAYKLFGHFKGLIFDRSISMNTRTWSQNNFLEADPFSAFKVIEYELSILYESLHTKMAMARRAIGFTFRFISFCFILVAFLYFLLADKHSDLDTFDIKITYALLIGAIVLDFISFIQLISSDSNLGALKSSWRRYIPPIIVKRGRWSESISQYNMISYCLDERPMWGIYKLAGFFHTRGSIDKIKIALFSSSEKVTEDVKALVFNELKTRSEKTQGYFLGINLCLCRGHFTLLSPSYSRLQWTVTKFEYEESLLLWHLATELCYHKEKDKSSTKTKRTCKLLSDYMFYLLVKQTSILSSVLSNWKVVLQDTCAEAKRVFAKKYKTSSSSSHDAHSKACEEILSVETNPNKLAVAVKGFKSKSVLFDACNLAKELQRLEDRWEVMDRMWVELMSYAAINCSSIVHAQQTSKGGELWTFTWLLMYHLGLGFHFEFPF